MRKGIFYYHRTPPPDETNEPYILLQSARNLGNSKISLFFNGSIIVVESLITFNVQLLNQEN